MREKENKLDEAETPYRAALDGRRRVLGPSHPDTLRTAAARAGVPVVPGTDDAVPPHAPDDQIARIADRLGYPLLVKAVAGGGGKGMRTVSDLSQEARACPRMALMFEPTAFAAWYTKSRQPGRNVLVIDAS